MSKAFNNRSVTSLLRTLKAEELREFEKFIAFKGKQVVGAMWKCLRKTHPTYDINDEEVKLAMRPDNSMKDSVYRVKVTELYRLAKDFVAYQEFQRDVLLRQNVLAHALLWRKDSQSYLKLRRETEKLYQGLEERSVEWYHHHFLAEDLDYQSTTLFQHWAVDSSLQQAADGLCLSTLAYSLKYLAIMRNRERITGESFHYDLEEKILDHLAHFPRTEEPVIQLYFLAVKLFKTIDNRELFDEFMLYFEANKKKIEASESRQLLTLVNNVAHLNIREGRVDYLKQSFDLIKIMVLEGLALVNGEYSNQHFRNIMRTAIRAKELDWATVFLAENINKTRDKERRSLEVYHRAYLNFAKGEYDLQMPFMHEMELKDFPFTEVYLKVFFRLLSIKTVYSQLGEQPKEIQVKNYKSKMNALRLYLRSTTDIADDFGKACLNFYKAMSQIFRMRYSPRPKQISREDIVALKPILELPWLLEVHGL